MSLGFLTRSGANWTVQQQKMARGLKFRIWEEMGLFFLCTVHSEIKGADQLQRYRAADLRHCFRIYAKRRFSHKVHLNLHITFKHIFGYNMVQCWLPNGHDAPNFEKVKSKLVSPCASVCVSICQKKLKLVY